MIKSTSVLLAIGCFLAGACRTEPHIVLERGVTRALALERASQIKDLKYDIFFSVPKNRAAPLEGSLEAAFRLEYPGPVVLDFAQPSRHVQDVRLDGMSVSYDVRDEHILIHTAAAGSHVVTVKFVAGEASLNRQDDFLYTLFVPDRARFAFPVFDQPNLKARYRLTLEIPVEWQAVSNTAVVDRINVDNRVTVAFAETEPISSYLLNGRVVAERSRFITVKQTSWSSSGTSKKYLIFITMHWHGWRLTQRLITLLGNLILSRFQRFSTAAWNTQGPFCIVLTVCF